MTTYTSAEQIQSHYPYLSDAPDHVLAQYREAEALRTLAAPGCIECGADVVWGERCSLCNLMVERADSAAMEVA